ncbi:MAG: hypothetical protein E7560_01850 [Ruminococcaceae bacterium]|nr:hypothetical protein [Oscillospiraceae bacterium]
MIILLTFLIALAAFSVGFLLGSLKPALKTETHNIKPDFITEVTTKEFENFLNYDGSEQV